MAHLAAIQAMVPPKRVPAKKDVQLMEMTLMAAQNYLYSRHR